MSHPVADRLWPMLLTLVLLVGGALLLQSYAERHGNAAVVVVVSDSANVDAAEDGSEEDDSPKAERPLDDNHARGQAEARRGALEVALGFYAKAVNEHPEAANLKDEYGYWLFQAKRRDEARRVLEEARTLSPQNALVALHLGRVYARLGEAELAETELRRAADLRKNFSPAQRALGNFLRRQKKHEEAIAVLKEAASAGSNEERARTLVELGTAQLALKQTAEAEKSFERAIEFAPARIENRIRIVRAWLATSDPRNHARAKDMLAVAVSLAPDLPQVYVAMGRVLERVGEDAEAAQAYEQALRLEPGHRYARRRLLRLALDKKEFSRARGLAEQLIQEEPASAEHHFLAAMVADREGRDDQARKHYEEAISRQEGVYPEAYFNLGLMERRNGRLPEAIAAYEKALSQRPTYLAAMNNLALAKDASGDSAGAERLLRQALEQEPKYAGGLLNLGELLLKLDRGPEAIELFRRALAARPGYAQARLNLGKALTQGGRHAEALETYRTLVEENPRSVAGFVALGVAANRAGRGDEALAAAKKALEVDPDDVQALRLRAEVEHVWGTPDEALAAWEELLDREPGDRLARLALAKLQLQKGQLSECAQSASQLLTRSSADPEARTLYARCSQQGAAAATRILEPTGAGAP